MSEVVANGVRLAYDVRGDGPTVVCISGTGAPGVVWRFLGADRLVDAGYEVVTFNNRGIPPSEVPPPPYTIDEMAKDTVGVLEHLGRDGYVLLGSSMGGMIAQRVALTRPELVRAVVFLAGCGNPSRFSRAQVEAFLDLLQAPTPPPASVLGAIALPTALPPTRWADDAAVDAALGMVSMMGVGEGVIGQYQAGLEWCLQDRVEELAVLTMPALAIAGQFDTSFPPVRVKEAAERMADARYVEIEEGTHMPADLSQVDAIVEAILTFLDAEVRSRS